MLDCREYGGLPDTITAPIRMQLWAARNVRARAALLWDHWRMNKTAERPRARSLSPLRALIPFLKPYRAALYAATGALLIASAAMLSLD